jgi:hypothetical protein
MVSKFGANSNVSHKCGVTQNSVNRKYSVVLKGKFRFKPASDCVERYHCDASCALNMEDLVSTTFSVKLVSNKRFMDINIIGLQVSPTYKSQRRRF